MHLSQRLLRTSRSYLPASQLLFSQQRQICSSRACLAEVQTSKPRAKPTVAAPAAKQPPPSPLEAAPRASGKIVKEFTPTPLSRPIGLAAPPAPGQNTGIDLRTWRQRRDDFVDYDKHLARRQQLTKKMATPYFRDWTNMRLHQGKTFLAPPGLFKHDRSLYFPNLYGQTLESKQPRDTTPLLYNMVSVVSVFSSSWAENQADTFVGESQNPELREVLEGSGGLAQLVRINVEENSLKAGLIKLFMPRMRNKLDQEEWGRYFLVRRGLSDEIRESIGILNGHVGYTYLVDQDCQIRWAGSGPANDDEKEGLVKGLRRLVSELQVQRREDAKRTAEELIQPAPQQAIGE